MKFLKITVARILAAAGSVDIDPTDTIDSLILQNAERHSRSLPGTVLNVSEAIVARVDALIGPAEKAKAQSKPAKSDASTAALATQPVIPQSQPVIPETVVEQPVVEEPVVEEPVVAEDVSKETAAE